LLGTSSLIPPLAERYWHGKGFVYILDANGRRIAVLWGKIVEKIAMAELICDAVSGIQTEQRPPTDVQSNNASRNVKATQQIPCDLPTEDSHRPDHWLSTTNRMDAFIDRGDLAHIASKVPCD
jgi:hypothetical protein